MSLFSFNQSASTAQKPLFASTPTTNAFGTSLQAQQPQQNQQQPQNFYSSFNPSSNQKPNPQSNPTSAAIDIQHLRPTTKFDQLTQELQEEIMQLDTYILSQINMSHELTALLPNVADSGGLLPNDVKYVSQKLEDLGLALENDAAEIVELRETVVKRDQAEGTLCFKNIDRLKMPSQYQSHGHTSIGPGSTAGDGHPGGTGSVYGGSGLSGWWNNPQMLQRSMRGHTTNSGSRGTHLADDEEVDKSAPGTLVDLFSTRADEMRATLKSNKDLLGEIEDFVTGVESKIVSKERELNDRFEYGGRGSAAVGEREGERENQIRLLKFVFGEVERSLFEVAGKVGECRDAVREVGVGQEQISRGRSGL